MNTPAPPAVPFGSPLHVVIPALALRPREAAKSLGISESLLGQWTRAGIVPHYRRESVVLYPVRVLEDWLLGASRKAGEGGRP